MDRGVTDAAIRLQIVADHLAHDTAAGTDGLVAAVRITFTDDRYPITVDEHFRYRIGIDKTQVCRLGMGDGTSIPGATGLILAAFAVAGIVDNVGLTTVDLHAERTTRSHLFQVLIKTRRHHAMHPFCPAGGDDCTVKPFFISGFRQDQTGIHIAAGIPVDATQAKEWALIGAFSSHISKRLLAVSK